MLAVLDYGVDFLGPVYTQPPSLLEHGTTLPAEGRARLPTIQGNRETISP